MELDFYFYPLFFLLTFLTGNEIVKIKIMYVVNETGIERKSSWL